MYEWDWISIQPPANRLHFKTWECFSHFSSWNFIGNQSGHGSNFVTASMIPKLPLSTTRKEKFLCKNTFWLLERTTRAFNFSHSHSCCWYMRSTCKPEFGWGEDKKNMFVSMRQFVVSQHRCPWHYAIEKLFFSNASHERTYNVFLPACARLHTHALSSQLAGIT